MPDPRNLVNICWLMIFLTQHLTRIPCVLCQFVVGPISLQIVLRLYQLLLDGSRLFQVVPACSKLFPVLVCTLYGIYLGKLKGIPYFLTQSKLLWMLGSDPNYYLRNLKWL